MRSRVSIIVVVLFSLLVSSCGDEFDFEEHYKHKLDKLEEKFAKSFESVYGSKISSDIDWTTVRQCTLNLDMSKMDSIPYRVCLYTSNPKRESDKCFLLADFGEKMGGASEPITGIFDCPTNMSSIYVAAIKDDGIGCFAFAVVGIDSVVSARLSGMLPALIPDHPAMRYTLAFEGFTSNGLDFDYNDVVLELEYVRGLTKEMRVILKAAGNDCHTRVSYRRPTKDPKVWVDEDIFEETHAAIGYPAIYNFATDKNIYYILNTGINDSGRSTDIFVDLEEDEGKSIVTIAQRFYAYFRLDDTKKELGDCYHLPDYTGARHPEALLIAEPDWTWAPEGQAIHVRYYRFKDWITDPKSQPQWYF